MIVLMNHTDDESLIILKNKSVLFALSNKTHVNFMVPIAQQITGSKFITFDKKENTNLYLENLGDDFQYYHEGIINKIHPDLIILGNDWGGQEQQVIHEARILGIPTVCIQEGPLDFLDLNTNRLQNADTIFLQGPVFMKYLNRESGVLITGNPKFDNLFPIKLPEAPKVMINYNFTYGFLDDAREKWIDDVVDVCNKLEINFFISKHPCNKGILPNDIEVKSSDVYQIFDQLRDASIIISGFDTVLYDAMMMGREVIYYNPHQEHFRIFSEDITKGIWLAENKEDLYSSLALALKVKVAFRQEKKHFLLDHCHTLNHDAAKNCLIAMAEIITSQNRCKDDHQPLVSVIIPTIDRPQYLESAIESIISQSFEDFEIIVVNDGGKESRHIIDKYDKKYKIRYVSHYRNLGLPEARNTGLRLAKGKYIAYLDDDDIFYRNHLSTLVGFLENNPDYWAAYTDANYSHKTKIEDNYVETKKDVPLSVDYDDQYILIENITPVLCVCHRKDCVKEIGFFNPSLKRNEDWEYWIRLFRNYKTSHIKIATCEVNRRYDESSMMGGHIERFHFNYLSFIYKYQKYAEVETQQKINARVEQNLNIIYDGIFEGVLFNGSDSYKNILGYENLTQIINQFLFLMTKYDRKFQVMFVKIIHLLCLCENNYSLFTEYKLKIEKETQAISLLPGIIDKLTWKIAKLIQKLYGSLLPPNSFYQQAFRRIIMALFRPIRYLIKKYQI